MCVFAISTCASVPALAAPVTYSTTFDLTESPVAERGAWRHDGLDWTKVETADGNAFGTQSGTAGFDDSYAFLNGFPADHSATAIVHRAANIDGSCTHEVELLLRWADSAHSARGYECNVAFDGSYAEIVRWNGPVGNFTYLARGNVPGGVHDGDKVSASVVGQTIVLWVNGKEIARGTDATYATGNPGIGFWRGGACGSKGDYAFTSFSATSAVTAVNAPSELSKLGTLLLGLIVAGWLWLTIARRKRARAVSPAPSTAAR
jgi:hypothetical protein